MNILEVDKTIMKSNLDNSNRVKTPPLEEDNNIIFLTERIDYLETQIDEKNELIENMYKEMINFQNRLELLELKVIKKD